MIFLLLKTAWGVVGTALACMTLMIDDSGEDDDDDDDDNV